MREKKNATELVKIALTFSLSRKLAATATLLNRQNPIGSSRSAWCPGGLTIATAEFNSPFATFSVAYFKDINDKARLVSNIIHNRTGILIFSERVVSQVQKFQKTALSELVTYDSESEYEENSKVP